MEGIDFFKLLKLVEVGKMALVHYEYRTLPVTVSVNQTCQVPEVFCCNCFFSSLNFYTRSKIKYNSGVHQC